MDNSQVIKSDSGGHNVNSEADKNFYPEEYERYMEFLLTHNMGVMNLPFKSYLSLVEKIGEINNFSVAC